MSHDRGKILLHDSIVRGKPHMIPRVQGVRYSLGQNRAPMSPIPARCTLWWCHQQKMHQRWLQKMQEQPALHTTPPKQSEHLSRSLSYHGLLTGNTCTTLGYMLLPKISKRSPCLSLLRRSWVNSTASGETSPVDLVSRQRQNLQPSRGNR